MEVYTPLIEELLSALPPILESFRLQIECPRTSEEGTRLALSQAVHLLHLSYSTIFANPPTMPVCDVIDEYTVRYTSLETLVCGNMLYPPQAFCTRLSVYRRSHCAPLGQSLCPMMTTQSLSNAIVASCLVWQPFPS